MIKRKHLQKMQNKGGMEEIDDPVPTVVSYTKSFEEDPYSVTEDFAKAWSQMVMKIEIYEYNRETSEDDLKDTIEVDLSYFLFPQSPIDDQWEFENIKVYSVNYLKLKITTDQPMLSEFIRKKLNPLQIFILAAKDVPGKTDPKYLPIYTVWKFVDGSSFQTSSLPQSDFCKFMHKHVILVGEKDPVEFKEQLASRTLDLELHDCEEEIKEGEQEAKFSYGLAKFHLKDFLNQYWNELKLRSDVFPVKRALVNNEGNLNLNTTARQEERAIEKSSPYLINGTFYVISVELAYNIGEFDEEKEIKNMNKQLAEGEGQEAEEPPEEPDQQKDEDEKQESIENQEVNIY